MQYQKTMIAQLFSLGAIKRGEFLLKHGQTSSIYVDLRLLVSYPTILRAVAHQLWDLIQHLSFDHLCAVPYTAIPIATCMSIDYNKPMLLKRKTPKMHGTGQLIEGNFTAKERCIVIEDVITSGGSVLETIQALEAANLTVEAVAVLVDRQAGGRELLEKAGYPVFSGITLAELVALQEESIPL